MTMPFGATSPLENKFVLAAHASTTCTSVSPRGVNISSREGAAFQSDENGLCPHQCVPFADALCFAAELPPDAVYPDWWGDGSSDPKPVPDPAVVKQPRAAPRLAYSARERQQPVSLELDQEASERDNTSSWSRTCQPVWDA